MPQCDAEKPRVVGGQFQVGRVEGSPTYVTRKTCGCGDSCGWPLQQFPTGWSDTAKELYDTYQAYVAGLPTKSERIWDSKLGQWKPVVRTVDLNTAHKNEGTSMHTLITCLRACVENGVVDGHVAGLDSKTVGLLHSLMAMWNSTRGLPGSSLFAKYVKSISKQRRILNANVPIGVFVDAVTTRLAGFAPDLGLENTAAVLGPVVYKDKSVPIPANLRAIVERLQIAPIKDHIESGRIKSAEMLADQLQALSAAVAASNISDPTLRMLMEALIRAFNNRRSLLLLNLEKPVNIRDIPWFLEVQKFCSRTGSSEALTVLDQLVQLTLTHFPHTLIPNKLLEVIRTLTASAGMPFTIVKEIAPDIFQGQFSRSFLEAAKLAATKVGSLYTNYFGLTDVYLNVYTMTLSDFMGYCLQLARIQTYNWWEIAGKGSIIERQQVITGQNLPQVCELLLDQAANWVVIVLAAWKWIVTASSTPPDEWKPRLQLRKNICYAWRQLVFYASQLGRVEQIKVLKEMRATVLKDLAFESCVTFFLDPLLVVAETGDSSGQSAVYGWTTTADAKFVF
jgi:hypothetical protein